MMERFDGAAHWARLSPEAQSEIGAIALELVAAWHCQDRAYEDFAGTPDGEILNRAGDAADQLLIDQLRMSFVDHIAEEELNDAEGRPRLPALLGGVCRRCGCSQQDACFPSCSWAEPDLCSACATPAGEAA